MEIVHEFTCASQIGKIMLEGVRDIVGQAGVNAISGFSTPRFLPASGPENLEKMAFSELSVLQGVLEALYGKKGGQGIALRAGRASTSMIFRKFGQPMGLNNLDYRLQPTPTRIKGGLETLAKKFSDLCGEPFLMAEDEEAWIWQVRTCPVCRHRQSEKPACYFIVGLLQEFVTTISGGKIYNVVESECLAAGAQACTFRVDKQAMD